MTSRAAALPPAQPGMKTSAGLPYGRCLAVEMKRLNMIEGTITKYVQYTVGLGEISRADLNFKIETRLFGIG